MARMIRLTIAVGLKKLSAFCHAAALLRGIEAANLFIVALDDDRTIYRYHHLVREVLRVRLRAMDRGRELALQLRVAEWLESAGAVFHRDSELLADGCVAVGAEVLSVDAEADPVKLTARLKDAATIALVRTLRGSD